LNNPGFDSFIIQTCQGDEHLALCYENRWSEDRSSTVLKLEDIKAKHARVFKKYKAMGSVKGVTCSQYCLVVVAWRGLEAELRDTDLPLNTLILDKPALEKLYGPTLNRFQQFYQVSWEE